MKKLRDYKDFIDEVYKELGIEDVFIYGFSIINQLSDEHNQFNEGRILKFLVKDLPHPKICEKYRNSSMVSFTTTYSNGGDIDRNVPVILNHIKPNITNFYFLLEDHYGDIHYRMENEHTVYNRWFFHKGIFYGTPEFVKHWIMP